MNETIIEIDFNKAPSKPSHVRRFNKNERCSEKSKRSKDYSFGWPDYVASNQRTLVNLENLEIKEL